MAEWVPIVLILLGIGVWLDASRLGWTFGSGKPGGAFSPWGWGLLVALLPLIFLPVYLVTRARSVRRTAADAEPR